jgi:hypothetical protein
MLDTVKEASYSYNLEDRKDRIYAEVISGFRTGESTGGGTDWTDARLIEIGGKNYLEILVRTKEGKGLTSPHPNDPRISDKQRKYALQCCEWAMSSAPIEGQPAPPNCGDSVEIFYEKGSPGKSNFNGLRYKSDVVTPQVLNSLQMRTDGSSGGFFGTSGVPLSPTALAALTDSKEGLQPNPNALVAKFKAAVEKAKQPRDGGEGAVWSNRYNIVGIRDASPKTDDKFNDYLYIFLNKGYTDYSYSVGWKDDGFAGGGGGGTFPYLPGEAPGQGVLVGPAVDQWEVYKYQITTKYGLKFDKYGGRRALYYEGQYKNSHSFRGHASKYAALGTRNKQMWYADDVKGDGHTYNVEIRTKDIGLNIHKAGGARRTPDYVASKVGGSSLGCQVFKKIKEFEDVMFKTLTMVKDGNKFTHLQNAMRGIPPIKVYDAPNGKPAYRYRIHYTLLRANDVF